MAKEAKEKETRYDWPDVLMLTIVMLSLTGIFLGGLGTILGIAGARKFEATEIVAILSLPVGVVSAVAAGIFGYSLGTRGTTEAQKLASAATEEAAAVRQDAGAITAESSAPARDIGRIISRAREGGEVSPGSYGISADDLNTLLSDVVPLASRLGIELPSPIAPPTPGGRPPQGQPGQ